MTAWWGLAGLAGLPGIYGLLRARASSSGRDPLARYPVAREPAVPNADAAHTPLMLPRITPDMLHHDGGQGTEPDPVPRARTGDHDSPVRASVSGPQYAPAALRPQAPPSAGRLARPGVPKKPAPVSASQSAEPEPDAALVPTQPFPANDDLGNSGTFTGDVAQPAPESPEEPQPVSAASVSAGQEKRPVRRLRETARHVAASAARTVQHRRGQFTRIFRKGNSR